MSIAYISQVYLIFRARLMDTDFTPGTESSAVKLFSEDEIPWDDLAFTVVRETLRRYFRDRPTGIFHLQNGRRNRLVNERG